MSIFCILSVTESVTEIKLISVEVTNIKSILNEKQTFTKTILMYWLDVDTNISFYHTKYLHYTITFLVGEI